MERNKFNFTVKAIEALPVPEKGKRTYYRDSQTRGLWLQVRDSGTKTFQFYRKIEGNPERISMGRFPDMNVFQARQKADEHNAAIARGENPADRARSERKQDRFVDLFQKYLEMHAKPYKKTWKEDESRFRRYLTGWKDRKLPSIRKSHVQKLHADTGKERGPYAANRLLSLLHGVFEKAREWGFEGPNPCQGVKKFKERSRERFIQADELPRFFQSLAHEPNADLRDFFLVCLLTGARRANVQAMRWEHVNLERGTWTIPGESTKTGDDYTVTLSNPVVEILEGRKPETGQGWVFPSSGKSGHIVEPKTAWKRILERAGIEDLRIHDLRRTLGSWEASTGASLTVIGKTLHHKNVDTTAIYARLNLDPVRQAVDRAVDAMLTAGGVSGGGEGGNVIDFQGGKKAVKNG